MQSFDILRETKPDNTFRVAAIIGKFDLQSDHVQERFVGSFDLPADWSVGMIVGRSGSGKTTIARELFGDAFIEGFEYSASSLLDDLPEGASIEDITRALNSVGFSSPPSWLKPYAVLSNGEKMRCDLARAILSGFDLFAFDEFTSVVDRNVARVGSYAVQKAVRRMKKKFVAVTCHYDVEPWLMPDWVFCTDDMTFRVCPQKKSQKSKSASTGQTVRKSLPFGELLANITI